MGGVANQMSDFAPRTANWSIFLSILLILAGFFTLMVPFMGGIGITIFVGWAMVISGITHLGFAWRTQTTGSRVWEFLVGLVYLAAGLYLVFHPLSGLTSLTLLLAFYLFFEAIFEIILFFQVRPRNGAGWVLFDGLVTLILAWMIWRSWPYSSAWAIGTLVGISMLFSGFSRLMLTMTARRILRAA
jgi:uncharacterized membrane protein HdeD (DUF308 family)